LQDLGTAVDKSVGGDGVEVRVRRISEPLQTDVATLADLRRVGALPGRTVHVRTHAKGVEVTGDGGSTTVLTPELAAHVLVRRG
jgi:DtxR family Mn-dependent transcriptional regulator